MSRPPVIGVSASFAPYQKGRPVFTDGSFDYAKNEYTDSIIDAGGLPIIIPNFRKKDYHLINPLLRMLDGLLLSGGSDLDSSFFGEENNPEADCVVRLRRDKLEMELLRRWELIRPDGPIMAICRGHQILNVFYGGTLYQDFTFCKVETIPQGHRTPEKHRTEHSIEVFPDTYLAEIIGDGMHTVNSSHHQGIKKLADGFRVSAKSPDGIIEAIEPIGDNRERIISIQWHPEALPEKPESGKLFSRFVGNCRNTI